VHAGDGCEEASQDDVRGVTDAAAGLGESDRQRLVEDDEWEREEEAVARSLTVLPVRRYRASQISTRFALKSGIATRPRLLSKPMSAGAGSPGK
jgi:hypothetical protein